MHHKDTVQRMAERATSGPERTNELIVLGIETSCDETAAAIYRGETGDGRGSILAERVASQIETHAPFGGVVPEVASREHLKLLPAMVDSAMKELSISFSDIDVIAVTAGPGLMGALLVGVSYAKALGEATSIPVVPVHHMEGHLLAPGLSEKGLPDFPFISLLVSGGHTMLVSVDAIGQYRVIGQTIDDAAGECFDKSARLLGLAYPGGPEIARLAEKGSTDRFRFPRPMLRKDNLNFSFSGLKTAVMYKVRELETIDDITRADLAAALQDAIADVLVTKSLRACHQEKVSQLMIAGGVAANQQLREALLKMAEAEGIQVFLPHPKYCTDNAAMIAYAGSFTSRGSSSSAGDAKPSWRLDSGNKDYQPS